MRQATLPSLHQRLRAHFLRVRSGGMTMIETLIVIGVIAVVAANVEIVGFYINRAEPERDRQHRLQAGPHPD